MRHNHIHVHAALIGESHFFYLFQFFGESEELLCQTLRESARMVSHFGDDFIDRLPIHNAILFGRNAFTADFDDNDCIGRA